MSHDLYTQTLYWTYAYWECDMVHTLRSVGDALEQMFGRVLDIRLVMYHLKRLVKEGVLVRIKYQRRTYYALRWTTDVWSELRGVRVFTH